MPRFCLLSLLLRNLDVTSQGHLEFFQIIFSLSQKYVFFMLGNNIFTFFDRMPSMALFALLGHPQPPIFEKCSPKYNMWYLWSLQTPSRTADSLKTEKILGFSCFCFGEDVPCLKIVNQSQFALFMVTLKKLTRNQMKKNAMTYCYLTTSC